jgi:hypothetical protein
MLLQLDQVVERVHTVQPAGLNQAHEQTADLRSVDRPIVQCVFPVR